MAPDVVGVTLPPTIDTVENAAHTPGLLNQTFGHHQRHLHPPGHDEAAAINGVMERKCFANLSATIRYSFGENQMTMLKIRLSNALTWVRTIQHSSPAHNQSLPW
jgi:hypothetical protein